MQSRLVAALSRAACRAALAGGGLALVLTGAATSALALDPGAPEIDPGSMSSALALLAGGALLLTERLRRRK